MRDVPTPDQLRAVLEPVLPTTRLDIEDVEVSAAGRRSVLRVVVDGDGGVSLDDIAEASRTVSKALDASDVMGERAYTLEVTSRGVDRPLTEPRHWRRNVTRLVKIVRTDGEVVTGRITDAGAESATLDVDGGEHEVPFAEVKRALVQVEFNRKDG